MTKKCSDNDGDGTKHHHHQINVQMRSHNKMVRHFRSPDDQRSHDRAKQCSTCSISSPHATNDRRICHLTKYYSSNLPFSSHHHHHHHRYLVLLALILYFYCPHPIYGSNSSNSSNDHHQHHHHFHKHRPSLSTTKWNNSSISSGKWTVHIFCPIFFQTFALKERCKLSHQLWLLPCTPSPCYTSVNIH